MIIRGELLHHFLECEDPDCLIMFYFMSNFVQYKNQRNTDENPSYITKIPLASIPSIINTSKIMYGTDGSLASHSKNSEI